MKASVCKPHVQCLHPAICTHTPHVLCWPQIIYALQVTEYIFGNRVPKPQLYKGFTCAPAELVTQDTALRR